MFLFLKFFVGVLVFVGVFVFVVALLLLDISALPMLLFFSYFVYVSDGKQNRKT